MTSETDTIKTNEFLRRRKLRLQQVREQSKDIAKKIRQRAKVEKLRQVVDLDAKKQKEYFECQEKLVKRLEVLYEKGLENVGASHHSASELTKQDEVAKTDLSQLRGKEATAELRKRKQEKLDQQKKLLDRKVHARVVANEISREKTSVVANKLLGKSSSTKVPDDSSQKAGGSSEFVNSKESNKEAGTSNNDAEVIKTCDMATQWEMEAIPEWEPTVPALSLPTDKDTPQNSDGFIGSKADKSHRIDLFALSNDMPSSLRGKHTHELKDREPGRPSLTIVSEYLQNRKLRLREAEPTFTNKKLSEDMQSLKQTIERTRMAKPEVPGKAPVCNNKAKHIPEFAVQRKNSVLMYNHSTRDSRDLPFGDKLVVRDLQSEEDAYSQAMKEESALGIREKGQKKVQDMRSKVAVTRQNVEKEYKDTMNFLNALPKDKGDKIIKNAFRDERRQQMQYENRQQKLQQEFNKIEKECNKHNSSKSRSQSRSPIRQVKDIEDNFDSRDFQYSWMPVPETDGNLAIHAIPNTVKQGKSGNSVKFSQVDSYHEYRSRHKHTPPTKDTSHGKPAKQTIETVVIDKNTTESSDNSSITSDTSSLVNMRVEKKRKHRNAKEINQNLSDAERIIIYKVLDSKTEKKTKRQTKLLNEIAKSLTCIGKVQQQQTEQAPTHKSAENAVSFEQLSEGIYKMVEEQGAGYKMSCCTTNVEMWRSTTPRKPWWDNIASMYYDERDKVAAARSEDVHIRSGHYKSSCKSQQCNRGPVLHWESGDCPAPVSITNETQLPGTSKEKAREPPPAPQPSMAPSSSSFITATNEKGSTPEGGYIKLVDEAGQDAGKFFIDSSGLLNNNAYEVVIQLRKKDKAQKENVPNDNTVLNQNKQFGRENNNNSNEKNRSAGRDTDLNDGQGTSDGEMFNVQGYRSDVDKQSTKTPPQPNLTTEIAFSEQPNIPDNNKKHDVETNTESDDVCLSQPASGNKKNVCEKGIHTCLTEGPKVEQLPRPSTTTYTQTTLSSPIHRPVFFHMSSSTSTAYMSPPEMILPKYLKRDCLTTEDETYDPIHNMEIIGKDYRNELTECMCRKYMLAEKAGNKENVSANCRKCENIETETQTNSANNTPEWQKAHDRERNMPSKGASIDKPKCRHNRRNVDHVKGHCHRNKRPVESFHSSRNFNNLVGIDLTSRNRKKPDQSRLNPIIRDYVNKLLALNREGLKAVEVAGQECSSVGTPGSSIVNVPLNVDERKSSLLNTISLEQIKNLLKQQIIEEQLTKNINYPQNSCVSSDANNKKNLKYSSSRISRKKPVHKVKSLNISKHFLKQFKTGHEKSKKPTLLQSSTEGKNKFAGSRTVKKTRSTSSPSARQAYMEPYSRFNDSESTAKNSRGIERHKTRNKTNTLKKTRNKPDLKRHQATATDSTVDSESTGHFNTTDVPVSMSTQTTQNMDINTDTNFMKLAEDKLQNMEKIADLTEKCTKRLSNLAKVLEEVRKNKSLAYSQISSTESSDSQSDKPVVSPITFDPSNVPQNLESNSPVSIPEKDTVENELLSEPINVLADIPKPVFKPSDTNLPRTKSVEKLDSPLHVSTTTGDLLVKSSRPKPPPALSRLSLKHGQEYIIPHELSTVIEVDSPMSTKHKSQSARYDAKEASNNSNRSSPEDKTVDEKRKSEVGKQHSVNPDLLQTKSHLSKMYKFSSTESSDDSKFQMIDLKQFNEIMLEPFISIQEYAKQYNMDPPDEGSNLDDVQREDVINDDISSLHSDGSLPDVIAELLKRNIITEPFKFDTASNINSTTISSESTLSMLALTKARRGRRSNVVRQNKENIGETSDTLSFSSNPDLENAFKKLGMGWASSTLKKTKERLALSSSSNTSSSSLSQFKPKSSHQEIPAIVTDSVSSVGNICKGTQKKNTVENSKNAEQQTTFSNSMTVKDFLRNELAKKITFTNKSNANDTQEFVSLFETKMPEEMKESSQQNREERSVDSARSANRARTSTPVQLFKSMTYRTSSSSNLSNGLFSNADDLSSVKMTSNSNKNHSTSDKDDLTIPTFSLRLKKSSDCSKSD